MQTQHSSPIITLLLSIIDEGYDREAWHGPNLRGSVSRVGAVQAAWRPAPDQSNIQEIVVHAAYWKYIVLRGLRRDEVEGRSGAARRGAYLAAKRNRGA